MQQLFIRLFNLSLSASILILVIIVLRKVFRKAPKWIICLLWGMVAVRLLLPFTIESALSLAPRAEVVRMDAGDTRPVVESGIESVDNRINTYVGTLYAENTLPDAPDSKVETNGTGNQPVNIVEILSMVWAAGVFLLLGYGIYSYLKVYRSVRLSVREEKNVYVCDDIKMPFILGILRPRIYLPSDLNASEKASILAHERAHIKRGDYLWKPLGYLLMTVYWFDPLIWLAYILLCRDIEMACDEKVVSNMSAEDKKQYSRVLLSFGTPDKMITICPLAFGEVGVKERVKGVLNYKKPAFWIILAAIMICILVVICFLTNAKDVDDNATLPKLTEKQLETLYQQEFEKHSDKMPSSVIFEFMSLSYDGRIYTAGREDRGIYVSAEDVPGNAWEKSLADYPLEKICDVYGALFVKPVYGDLNADGQYADVYTWYDDDRKVKGECKEGTIWELEGYAPEDQVILTIPQVNAFGRIEYEMITFRHMNDVKIETGRDLLNIVLKAQNVDQYGVIGQPDTLQTFTGDSLEDKYFIRDFVKAPVVSSEMITDIGTYQTIMIRERAPYDRFIELRDYGDGIIGYHTPEGTAVFFQVDKSIKDDSEYKTITIAGSFTATVEQILPDYNDLPGNTVAVVHEAQSSPFLLFFEEDMTDKLQIGTSYVFYFEPFEAVVRKDDQYAGLNPEPQKYSSQYKIVEYYPADVGSVDAGAFQGDRNVALANIARVWAGAFCERNGYVIGNIVSDELKKSMLGSGFLEEANGQYSLGYSSSWPTQNNAYLVTKLDTEASTIEILYYVITSNSMVTVWREILHVNKDGGVMVTGEELQKYDTVETYGDFEAAYPVIDHTWMDYTVNGLAPYLYQSAQLSSSHLLEKLQDPCSAAKILLHLPDNENIVDTAYYVSDEDGYHIEQNLAAYDYSNEKEVTLLIALPGSPIYREIRMIKLEEYGNIWVPGENLE